MQTATDEATEDAVPLCPGCFHVLENDPDFCPGCNAPIGAITLIDPLREAMAYAYLYRRGVEYPNRPLIFWGMVITAGAYRDGYFNTHVGHRGRGNHRSQRSGWNYPWRAFLRQLRRRCPL